MPNASPPQQVSRRNPLLPLLAGLLLLAGPTGCAVSERGAGRPDRSSSQARRTARGKTPTSHRRLPGFTRPGSRQELKWESTLRAFLAAAAGPDPTAQTDGSSRPPASKLSRSMNSDTLEDLSQQLEEAGLTTWRQEIKPAAGSSPAGPTGTASLLARIPGVEMPDRTIILGTRWSSRTPRLTALALGLAHLLERGWQPRRTVVLAWWNGPQAARIWREKHSEEAGSLLAYLHMAHADGHSPLHAAPSPEIRKLAAAAWRAAGVLTPLQASPLTHTVSQKPRPPLADPDGRQEDALFLARAVPALLLKPGAGAARANPMMGILALRLADAAVPPFSYAVTSLRLTDQLRELLERSQTVFHNNPPPSTKLRLALANFRDAAENWEQVSSLHLEQLRRIPVLGSPEPAAPAGATQHNHGRRQRPALSRALRKHADLKQALAYLRHTPDSFLRPAATQTPRTCRSLLVCPDRSGGDEALILPGIQLAVELSDRSLLTAEYRQMAAALQTATRRLDQARLTLENTASVSRHNHDSRISGERTHD